MTGRLVALVAAAGILCGGASCPTPEQAALNRRNIDLAQELAKSEDPAVAAPGSEIASNAGTLDTTLFSGVGTAETTPASAAEAAELRENVAEEHAAAAGFWSTARDLVGSIPWGSALLGGITTAGAGLAWLRELLRRKAVRAALAATARGVDAYRDGGISGALGSVIADPVLREAAAAKARELLRELLEKAHVTSGTKADVEAMLTEVRAAGA